MHIINPDAEHAAIVNLIVRIDPERASLLYNNAARSSDFDSQEGFEVLDGAAHLPDDCDAWDRGRLMWCDSVLEAIVLADYETACGYQSQLLWDLATFGSDHQGHVVLSSRPLDFGVPGH